MISKTKSVVLSVALSLTVFSGVVEAQIIQVSPNYNLTRATQAVKKGEFPTARKYLLRASKDSLSNQQLSSALTDLCGIDYALGNLESAEKACNRAIRVDRKNWRTYFNRGAVLRALGRKGAAEADYVKAAELKPNDARIKDALATLNNPETNKFAENR